MSIRLADPREGGIGGVARATSDGAPARARRVPSWSGRGGSSAGPRGRAPGASSVRTPRCACAAPRSPPACPARYGSSPACARSTSCSSQLWSPCARCAWRLGAAWSSPSTPPLADLTGLSEVTTSSALRRTTPNRAAGNRILRAVATAAPRRVGAMERTDPGQSADELTMLSQFVDYHRATLMQKASGLGRDQLGTRLEPSSLTLAGLLKHAALVEDSWFGERLLGLEPREPWASVPWDDDPDWEFRTALDDEPDELLAFYADACERSRAAVAQVGDLDAQSVGASRQTGETL